MSRNGSGTYTLPVGNPVVTGTTISTTWANTTLTDIANTLTASVASDGQTPMTGSLNMASNKIISVTDPTNAQDAATKAYADALTNGTAAGSFTSLAYSTTLTGGTGVVNLGSGQFYKDASGNVGIGTASPTAGGKLDVNGIAYFGAADKVKIYSNNILQNAGTLDIGTIGSAALIFDTANTERMRIDSNGKVLIGTTTYSAYINGIGIYSDVNGGVVNVGHTTSSGSGAGFVLFGYNNGGIGSITQNGTTGVLFNTTSDYRLKTDVAPITNALNTIEALNPVSFTWIDGRPDDGFLAHELQTVIPNCITGEKDAVNEDGTPKYQQMDNSGVIPFLVKAIQELNAKVDAQTLEIATLKAK